jgi:hypothetical protein
MPLMHPIYTELMYLWVLERPAAYESNVIITGTELAIANSH